METLPGNFWTIATVVLSAFALHFAAKADRRKDFEQAERRRAEGEKRLAEQIAQVDQRAERRQGEGEKRLGARIDSLERRVDENHRELSAALAETKAAVKVLGAKLDER